MRVMCKPGSVGDLGGQPPRSTRPANPREPLDPANPLERLTEPERRLIHQLFWDGRCADDLAREWGVSRQAVSKRKQKILLKLRRQVGMP